MRRAISLLAGAVACATLAAPADAYWSPDAGAAGSGAIGVETLAVTGEVPAAVVTGQSVSLEWAETRFRGEPLGSYPLGGYRVSRESAVGGALERDDACPDPASAPGGVTCVEAGVGYGEWRYRVTPLMGSFTGTAGPASAIVGVLPPAPASLTATPLAPAHGSETGAIGLAWEAVADATGYRVYRRELGGQFGDALATVVGATFVDDSGLLAETTYEYALSALGGEPPLESDRGGAVTAQVRVRPPAPTLASAVAVAGGAIELAWASAGDGLGYRVERALGDGPFSALADVAGVSHRDETALDGLVYRYRVRSLDAHGIESSSAVTAGPVTADATLPAAPVSVVVTGGTLIGAATCTVPAGTRLLRTSASVTVTGSDELWVEASGGGQTVSAPVTSAVAATLDLSALPDGPVSITAHARDAAGNRSAPVAAAGTLVKDTVGPAVSELVFVNNVLSADRLNGRAECGASVRAVEEVGLFPGRVYPTSGSFVVTAADGRFTGLTVSALSAGAYRYAVSATDLAGNTGPATQISGVAVG